MNDVNVRDYYFDEKEIPIREPQKSKYRVKHTQRFVCMPESWALRAFELAKQKRSPGPLIMSWVLWQRHRMRHGEPFNLGHETLRRFNIERHSAARWLFMLEHCGLITVRRFKHRSPEITIQQVRDWK